MNINDYAADLTRREGGKKQISIAQVKEVLALINRDLWGIPYFLIRLKRKPGAGVLGNERGEIATLTMLAIAGVLLVVTAVMPSLNPVNTLLGKSGSPSAANQKASWTRQTEREKPVFYKVPGTDTLVVDKESERTYDTGTDERPPKLTFGERIGAFFARLTIWGIVLVGGLALFFPGVLFFLINRVKNRWKKCFEDEKAERERVEQALTNTVAALRKVPKDVWETTLKPLLESKHDKQDRVVVDQIKAKLHSDPNG